MSQLPPPAGYWRQLLTDGREQLRQQFLADGQARALLRAHCRLVDGLLSKIFAAHLDPAVCALVAVGGYGRGELFPASDIDLLLLLQAPPDEDLASRIETLVSLWWDMGLSVGHSVRTVEECLAEAGRDVTIHTNLLSARQLAGNPMLFARLTHTLKAEMDARTFFQAKLNEQQRRHQRHQDVAYRLEPNIKESPGGLRDLHSILWMAQAAGIGANWRALVQAGLLEASEARTLARHETLLFTLRIHLHYLANRCEDRLAFDFQSELARQMGCQPRGRRRASEVLMQRYYRTAKSISLLNEILVQQLRERITPAGNVPPRPVNERFQARRDLLEARDPGLFAASPGAILECFRLLQDDPALAGISPMTLRALWRNLSRIDARFRRNPAHQMQFMAILRARQRVISTLRLIHRYGVLGRYIPAFGRIVGQMQHDLYHVYTVDEHILFVVRNLRRFALPELAHEFPLCSRLMSEFERPELLYVAGLFHDIAKGRGGDHSQLGRADTRRFCQVHGLSAAETELCVWLVEQHLTMSATAQKKDLSDPAVIDEFAALVRDERHLAALYLLTVADIRGTSPKVWNAWKGKLLEDLYHATLRRLQGERADPLSMMDAKRKEALMQLARQMVPPGVETALWQQLDEGYFLRHDAGEIAWHTRLLNRFVVTNEPIVRARLDPAHDGILVLTYLPDHPALFAQICGTFERLTLSIVEAKIHTTRHGYALNSFMVLGDSGDAAHRRDLMSYIEYEVKAAISGSQLPAPPAMGRISRQLKHFPVQPKVSILPDERGSLHVVNITAGDRTGLLSTISRVFVRHDIRLHTAKINTLGERALDVFLISAEADRLNNERVVAALQTDLLQALS